MRATILALLLVLPSLASAQHPPEQQDMAIDADTRAKTIEGVLATLEKRYVYPDIAEKMDAAVRERQKNGEYNSITSSKALAEKLMTDLRAVSNDRHLRVLYSFEAHAVQPPPSDGEPPPEMRERILAWARGVNFGFQKVELLSGNVGYLDLRQFAPAEIAGETAAAAMNWLANTDALIIDLRQNGGGNPEMVALVCSYLFDHPVHLNDLYWRARNETHQWWTLPYVPGRRYGDKPVYLLTSSHTFSAAEEFAYDLKNLKRVTVVGETTGGGAHPGVVWPVTPHFAVWVPEGRAINPVTKTDWEGTGVAPDIAVPERLALATAHLNALEKVKNGTRGDEVTRAIAEVRRELEELKAKQ